MIDSWRAFLDLWGKSQSLQAPYPLVCHLLDTAGAAQVITERVLPHSLATAVAGHVGVSCSAQDWAGAVRVLAGWHDIGKASCGFQNLDKSACPDWARGHRDSIRASEHALTGAWLTWDRLGDIPTRTRSRVAQIIGGHHGCIPRLDLHQLQAWGGAAQVDENPPSELESARRWLWDTLDGTIGTLPEVAMPTPAASAALAVVVLADWVASDEALIHEHQSALEAEGFDAGQHYQRALRLTESYMKAAGLVAPKRRKLPEPADLIDGDEPTWRGLQASIHRSFHPTSPGISVICAPTGEGKTEAALIAAAKFSAASERHGMFFAMPTVATAEGLHDRLRRCIENLAPDDDLPILRRVHSQALLADSDSSAAVSDDSETMRAAASWMRGTRKSLLAPFGVGTIDQVLLGALRAKHSPLRILGAASGVLIVDEVHALDPYMRKLLCRAVEWLAALGTPVVILSATLPPKRVRELCSAYQEGCGIVGDTQAAMDGYPAWIGWTPADGWTGEASQASRSWDLRIGIDTVERKQATRRIAETALHAANHDNGQCVLIVRSTVAAAQETYQAIRELDPSLVPGESVETIHSRLPRGDRRRRADNMLRRLGSDTSDRPERLIVVATQVVEQSFDVDFDLLITDPAPLPALLQRAGRVRRHRTPADGEYVGTTVVWPLDRQGEPSHWSPIYSRADLMGAHACITSADTKSSLMIRVPDDVPVLVERADIEAEEKFEFADEDAADAAEATLAQLVRIDAEKSLASNWAIPPPRPDAPLHLLTGHLDTDETHPGTRHQAHSTLIVPCMKTPDGWTLADGTVIVHEPQQHPSLDVVRKVFEASIPVSYPNPGWSSELPHLAGAWDRTPVAQAQILDVSAGPCDIGEWTLRVDGEAGLVITKEAA
ncbi:CRISPR-associated helicase Cas3' [Candidatus Poriferisodalis sp.]|uniref:CRISPR-associated helicase Cas3' n=1 Tax=Candidatus Poriferisodalis sp. TaxID=3101277 RepID=UPI003B029B48